MTTKRDFYKLAAAEDHNRVEFCRTCNSKQMGRVCHAPDAMGLPTEVLWNCFRCANPPALVGFWRKLKARTGRVKRALVYWYQTTPEERQKHYIRREKWRARVNMQRIRRGDDPLPPASKLKRWAISGRWR